MTADPANFYTGLIAELYEPLAGGITDSARFIEFVEHYGQPALEMCCGTGLPLLDLVAAGLDVEGLDSSSDMLALCRRKAQEKGLQVKLHLSRMQDFETAKSFQSVYIANGSITLLPNDESLKQTLRKIHGCLRSDGVALIDLDTQNMPALRKYLGKFKELSTDEHTLRVGMTSLELGDDHTSRIGMRYEREAVDGSVEVSESIWIRRILPRNQFRILLEENGFEIVEEVVINPELTQLCARKAT